MKKANGEDKPGLRGQPTPEGPLTLKGPLPVYFQVTSSRIRLLSSGMYFLSQAQQWTCWSVGEIMKKLKVRPKVIKTRRQKNDQEAAGSQLESMQCTERGQRSLHFQEGPRAHPSRTHHIRTKQGSGVLLVPRNHTAY